MKQLITNNDIFIAIDNGDLESVKCFLDSNVDIDVQDEQGNSLLMHSLNQRQTVIAKFLLTQKPDLYLYNSENFTVFPIARNLEDKTIYNLLLDNCLNKNDNIFLIGYHAKPKNKLTEIQGAYINCYIVDTSFKNAQSRSKELVENEDWIILSTEEEIKINRMEIDNERKQYIEQVIIDKEVLVFYTYENEEDE